MSETAGGFLGVFEQRVHRLRKRLKDELAKDKHDRSKHTLKITIKEIKEWEEVLHKQIKVEKKCPHCGIKLDKGS